MDTFDTIIQALAERLFQDQPAPDREQEAARRRTVVRRAFARMTGAPEDMDRILEALRLSLDGCPVCGSQSLRHLAEDSRRTGATWHECLDCGWHYRVTEDGEAVHPDDEPGIIPGKGTQPDPRARKLIEEACELDASAQRVAEGDEHEIGR